MTELYSSYTSDHDQLLSSIQSTLESVISAKGEAKAAALRRADMEADEAEEILAQMELEVQGMPQAIKPRYQVELRGKKAELEGLRKRLVSETRQVGAVDACCMGLRDFVPIADLGPLRCLSAPSGCAELRQGLAAFRIQRLGRSRVWFGGHTSATTASLARHCHAGRWIEEAGGLAQAGTADRGSWC